MAPSRRVLVSSLGAAALATAASADFAGFVAFARNAGGNTVIDVFAGVTAPGDRFLNAFDLQSNGTFVQKAGVASKTWKPDAATFTSMRSVTDDSFMTAGTFGGGEYGGEFYASANTNGDPNFSGTSWNATLASPAATTIPSLAGWYSGDPGSVDNGAEALSAIPGTRMDSTKVSGTGASTSGAATHGIWVAHLVLAGENRSLAEGGTATWDGSASVKVLATGATVQGRYRFTLPAGPTGVAASDGSSTAAVDVSWNAVSGATGYRVFRAIGSGAAAQVGLTAAGVLGYADTTAVAGTLYTYSVKATTAAGDTAASAGDPGWRNVTPPTIAASDGTSTAHVAITWAARSDVTGYKVLRAVGAGASAQVGANLAGTASSFNDTTAVAGTLYNYSVRAMTAAGDSAPSAANPGWRNIAAPGGVGATDGSSTANVTVTWSAAAGATGYKVWRAVGAGAAAQVGTAAAGTLAYADATAIAGTLYAYSVTASTAAGDSAASAPDNGWRNVAAPAGTAATDGTLTTQVTVSWGAVASATGYKVFRAVGAGAAAQVGATAAGTLSYADAAATAGTVYTYTVKATTAAGDSVSSGSDTGWRNLPAPTGLNAADGTSTANVTLTWAAVTGATGYQVVRSSAGTAAAVIGSTVAPTVSFVDSTAVAGTLYTYGVRSQSAAGVSALSATNAGWRNVSAPTGLNASDGSSTAQVSLAWTAVPGATGYKVFRALGLGAPAQVGTTAAGTVAFADTSAVAGTVYTYTVKATTAAGDSAASASNTGWRNIAPPTGTNATDGTSSTQVTVTWNAAAGATGYKVFRALPPAAAVQVGTTAAAVRTFADTTGVAGTVYTYTVKATTAAGDSAASAGNTGFRSASAGMPGGSGETADAGNGPVAGLSGAARATTAAGTGASGPGAAGTTGSSQAGTARIAAPWSPASVTGGEPPATCELVAARVGLMQAMATNAGFASDLEALLAPTPAEPAANGSTARAPVNGPAPTHVPIATDAPASADCIACRMLAGDVTLDGLADADDLLAWIDAWSDADWRSADLDRDGWIDDRDLAALLRGIGTAPAGR